MQSLCNDLQKEDDAEEVVVSTDPGRFVCNYTYCISLDKSATQNHVGDEEQTAYHSLFIHVPPFSVVPEDRQYDFVLQVIDTIWRQVSNNP